LPAARPLRNRGRASARGRGAGSMEGAGPSAPSAEGADQTQASPLRWRGGRGSLRHRPPPARGHFLTVGPGLLAVSNYEREATIDDDAPRFPLAESEAAQLPRHDLPVELVLVALSAPACIERHQLRCGELRTFCEQQTLVNERAHLGADHIRRLHLAGRGGRGLRSNGRARREVPIRPGRGTARVHLPLPCWECRVHRLEGGGRARLEGASLVHDSARPPTLHSTPALPFAAGRPLRCRNSTVHRPTGAIRGRGER
jgi:hypothetical protein